MAKEKQTAKKEVAKLVETPTRGRTFEGSVTKKFPNRVVIEFERTVLYKEVRKILQKENKVACKTSNSISKRY